MSGHNSSLLAHVAAKLTSQVEVLATESLSYVLSQSAVARRALELAVRNAGADVGQIARVETEVSGEAQERLDLVCFGADGSERVLIEAKFWAGLTPNQPATYLERLKNAAEPAILLFVAPATRLDTLWPEVRRRVPAHFSLEEKATDDSQVRTATVDGSQRWLMLTSWRKLLGAMSSRASDHGDVWAERDILQLDALCEQQDVEAFLPLRSDEFAPAVPRRLLNLQKLVDDATELARQREFADTTRLNVTPQSYGYGRYLRLGGPAGPWANAWFGVNFERWARERETPLWLHFNGSEMSLAEITRRVGNDRFYFDLPTGVEYEAVLDTVLAGLEWIAERIVTDP